MKVLDYGYVEFIEAWGHGKELTVHDTGFIDHEIGIIEAARQSTQGNFRGWAQDRKLLEYLYDNKHETPFEFAGMILEIRAPILVFREWHRHRTQSYNEMSARYASIPTDKYLPSMDRLMQVNEPNPNKQAGSVGGIPLAAENAMKWLTLTEQAYAMSAEAYRFGLAVGVAKELARCPMPVSNYSQMRASANLRNWLAFLTLRTDPRAQWEIRQYALAVEALLLQKFPQTGTLFVQRKS
jgi:thymidylate synthase (FAD)